MNIFTLELLFNMIGIGTASGLFYKDSTVLIVGDNSDYLYEYQIGGAELNHYALVENAKANVAKKDKSDFEAITQDDDHIYIFGSGSTEKRNKMLTLDAKSKAVTASIDLTNLYSSMQSFGKIKPEDFNIEGVVKNGTTWYFLQRGNIATGKNGIFTVDARNLENDFTIVYNECKLPKINGVRATFTDATMVGDVLYFLATSENTDSTYHDGEILGSLVGSFDLKKMKVGNTQIISQKNKFEGITFYRKTAESIEFLLCDDNDADNSKSGIYKLSFEK